MRRIGIIDGPLGILIGGATAVHQHAHYISADGSAEVLVRDLVHPLTPTDSEGSDGGIVPAGRRSIWLEPLWDDAIKLRDPLSPRRSPGEPSATAD